MKCEYCGEERKKDWGDYFFEVSVIFDDGTTEEGLRCNECVSLLYSECPNEIIEMKAKRKEWEEEM